MGRPVNLGIVPRKQELERLGFDILEESGDELLAVRSKWHLDAFFTKVTVAVQVKRMVRVDGPDLVADYQALRARLPAIDPSKIPVGFQKGRMMISLYLVDESTDRARRHVEAAAGADLGVFYFPAILEAGGAESYKRDTAWWGAMYYPLMRFFARRLLDPTAPAENEPLSIMGIVLSLLMAGLILAMCGAVPLMILLDELF